MVPARGCITRSVSTVPKALCQPLGVWIGCQPLDVWMVCQLGICGWCCCFIGKPLFFLMHFTHYFTKEILTTSRVCQICPDGSICSVAASVSDKCAPGEFPVRNQCMACKTGWTSFEGLLREGFFILNKRNNTLRMMYDILH